MRCVSHDEVCKLAASTFDLLITNDKRDGGGVKQAH